MARGGGGMGAIQFLVVLSVGGSLVYIFLLESTGYVTPLHGLYMRLFD